MVPLFGQVGGAEPDVAEGCAFEGQLVDVDGGLGREGVSVLRHVDVAGQEACQAGHVGQHVREFAQVEPRYVQRDVVGRVLRLAVDLKRSAVVGQQVDVGVEHPGVADVEVVVVVDAEVAVGDDGPVGEEADGHAAVAHEGFDPDIDAFCSLAVDELEVGPGAARAHKGVGVDAEVVRVVGCGVDDAALHLDSAAVLHDEQAYAVELQLSGAQGEEVGASVEATQGVGVEVDEHAVDVDAP